MQDGPKPDPGSNCGQGIMSCLFAVEMSGQNRLFMSGSSGQPYFPDNLNGASDDDPLAIRRSANCRHLLANDPTPETANDHLQGIFMPKLKRLPAPPACFIRLPQKMKSLSARLSSNPSVASNQRPVSWWATFTAMVCSMWLIAPAFAAIPLKVLGFDDMSCRSWSASKDDGEQRQLYVAWIRGVLSGHNYANPGQQVSAVSSATVEQYVNRFCTEKPRALFSDAAFRLSDQLSGRNSPITK